MTEIENPQENNQKENEIEVQPDSSNNYSRELIKSILDSKELTNIIDLKLEKYKNALRKVRHNKNDKDHISKLEEGYESSDSGDSVKSSSTVLTSTTSSTYSGLSFISSFPNDINTMLKDEKTSQQKTDFFKIYNEINMLKTVIPKEKTHNLNKINNNDNPNVINNEKNNNNKNENKKGNNDAYPLEYFEIFPNLNKYKIGNESSNVFIENPILFVKNLILKNYNESLSFTQNKFHLQNFKNSPDYRYEIMNKSEPINMPLNNDDITCMIIGCYKKNEDKKNKKINDFNEVINKLRKKQSIEVNFFFFGYKNGLIRQNALLSIKADPTMENSLPADSFLPYREYSIEKIIEEEKIDKHVLCMSLSDNEDYLLAGYASGHIIIWKTTNGKYLYIFDEIFDMPVVACEFLSVSENHKDFHFLVSDLIGKVYLVHLEKNTIMKDNFSKIIVSKCFYPCLLIKKLRFNNKSDIDTGKDFDINIIINNINKKPIICILGNLEYIEIISINRKTSEIYNVWLIKNPDLSILSPMTEEIKNNRAEFYSQKNLRESLSEIEFPDACFGLGFLGDLDKCNDSKYPDILFAYSWKNIIKLYSLNNTLEKVLEIGWYYNNSPIIKIDFIGVSLLYLLDKNNNIKIINIKLFNHFTQNEKDEKKRKKNKFLIPLSDIISLENPVKTISKTFTETINFYNPFIAKSKYNIFIIDDMMKKGSNSNPIKNIKHIHLLSYSEFFNETMKETNWRLFFCKFIDIIKTGTNTLGNIPENQSNKENLLIIKKPNKLVKYDYLKHFLMANRNDLDDDDDELDALNDFDYLSIAIEFAIEIGSIDFIYNEIKKMDNVKIIKKELIKQLETFILNNKFQNDPNLISDDLINDIISYYISGESGKSLLHEEEKDVTLLKIDLILCHLHIDIIKKIKNIETIIEENKLSCSLIYYYSNSLNDFIKPLKYLFEEFMKLKPRILPKEIYKINFFKRLKMSRGYYRDNYYTLLKSLKSGLFDLEENNLFKSKEYIGHLLLFYIQLTLKEYLFPSLRKINNLIQFNKIVQEMFLFLTKKEVAEEMIKFDSYSYFETLTLFFFREEEINMMVNDDMFNSLFENKILDKKKNLCPLIIDDIDKNKLKENFDEYNKKNEKNNNTNDDKKIKNDNPKIENNEKIFIKEKENEEKIYIDKKVLFFGLIKNIISLCNNIPDNILLRFDLNLFIINLSLKIDDIPKDILKTSLLSIFNFYNDIKKLKLDLNSLSTLFERIDRFGNHYTLIRRKQSALDNISATLNFYINKYYIKQKASTDEINNLFKICFTSYFLGVKVYIYEIKKDYVNCINVYLNEKKKISRRVFAFINKTLNLLKENKEEKMLQLYKNEIKKKITNLARVSQSETFKIIQKWFNSIDIISSLNNLPKLQFRYIDKLRGIYKRKLKRERDIINDITKKEYSDILLIYIKLLFYFDKEKRVLKLFHEEEEYINVNECLKICINKSIEASVYLYKLIGDEQNALKMCLNQIKQNYEEIKKKDGIDTVDERFENLFKEIKVLIDESIDICENYSENSELFKKRRNSQVIEEKNLEKSLENHGDNEMGEEYWLELFGDIYNILKDAGKRKALIFSKIKNYLTEKIENLLITMSYFVSFNFILKSVTNELEFSLIKNFLNKNIYTKSHLSNLYKSYINLISYKINKDMKIVEKNSQKGNNINLITTEEEQINFEKQNLIVDRLSKDEFHYKYSRRNSSYSLEIQNKGNKIDKPLKLYKKCTYCSQMLNFINEKIDMENNDIIIFRCEHIYHVKCLKKEYSNIVTNLKSDTKSENNFCPKCININTELFSFIGNDKKEMLDRKENNQIGYNIIEDINDNKKTNFSSIENRKKRVEEKMKKKNIKKLMLLDNNYYEQINILENTLDGI